MKNTIDIVVCVTMLAFIVTLFGCGKRNKSPSHNKVVAPVDLDKPVKNPELVTALDAYTNNPSPEARTTLSAKLNKAIFLLPMMTDLAQIIPSETDPGQGTFEKGSLLKVFIATDADGNLLLPLFTDGASIRSWTTQAVTTLVLPAQDAWGFATTEGTYSGVVINPGGHNLELKRSELEKLKTN